MVRGNVSFVVRQNRLFQWMFSAELGQPVGCPELAAAGAACHQLLSSAVGQVFGDYESPKTARAVATLANNFISC